LNTVAQEITAESLIRKLRERADDACATCSGGLPFADMLMSIAMGFQNKPLCLPCLAGELRQEIEPLRSQLLDYFSQRECYEGAWRWVGEQEDSHATIPTTRIAKPTGSVEHHPSGDTITHHAEWDAGDMSCGDLVLELRMRMQKMPPLTILKLRATDPGAPADLPAWCGLIGHRLVRATHPEYWIERKV